MFLFKEAPIVQHGRATNTEWLNAPVQTLRLVAVGKTSFGCLL